MDSSCIVALALAERGSAAIGARLAGFTRRVASNLLEAEVRAVLARERVELPVGLLEPVEWILPSQPLSREIATVARAGYVRGADLWHLACALLAAREPASLTFLTLDMRQREVAERLGFAT